MAQGNQITGFFGSHDAGNAGNAQDIALFSRAFQDDGQSGRVHQNAALSHGHAVGRRFAGNVHHMGLTVRVEMCQS